MSVIIFVYLELFMTGQCILLAYISDIHAIGMESGLSLKSDYESFSNRMKFFLILFFSTDISTFH